MIDQNSQFFAMLTNVGMAKQANADALGIPWKITDMGVGDANGADPIPTMTQTRLINEWRRRPLNQLKIDPANSAVIIAEQVIPADEGGKWIREIGLYDADGDLIAVANCAPSFKPVLAQGSGRTQIVRMNLIVSSAGSITLKIDPSVVLATRDYVEKAFAPINAPALINPTANTPPQFNKSLLLATTEYVRRELGSFSSFVDVTESRSLKKSDMGAMLWLNGSSTLSLPTPLSLGLPTGAAFNVCATSKSGLVSASAGVIIQTHDGARPSSYKLDIGQSARFLAISDNEWLITDSTASLELNSDFQQSKTTNGYQYSPGGMLECWGRAAVTNDKVSVTFAQEFENLPFVVPYDSAGLGASVMTIWQMTDITTTGFVAQNICTLGRGNTQVSGAVNANCIWRAFGWGKK